MKFKISCPHCSHSLSLADPKPGKYKPKCSSCNTQFVIVVEAGEPPKVRVGKLAAPSNPLQQTIDSTLPTQAPSQASPQARSQAPSQAPSHVVRSTAKPSGFDATTDSSLSEPRKPTGFDATLDGDSHPATQAQALDQTLPAATNPQASSSKRSADTSAADFSVDATQPTTQPTTHSTKPTESSTSIDKLGGYRIVKELGAGGMGKVYLARQISLDRPCAIKTIQAGWAENPRAIARFIREAYAAAQLTHHNVVQIYDLGQDRGTNFFSMELVGGGSLDEQLKAKGKLPARLAATLILQAARGLKFAHDHGMVHRDIKPANLMLTSDGLVKIADMGLVKTPLSDEASAEAQADVQSMMLASARSQVTLAGASMGTPAYMSPEQAADAASVDKRADIYSLGCTFYALLTGKPPFDGQTLLEVITKHRQEKITRPEVVVSGLPTVLGDIIERMTAKQPDDRYQDLDEVINDLEVFLELREDLSKAKISYFDSRDRSPASDADRQSGEATEVTVGSVNKSAEEGRAVAAAADIPTELTGKIQLAARSFQSFPLLWARKFAPLAWYGLCGLLCVVSLLLAMVSGGKLLAAGAKSITASATEAVGSLTGSETPQASAPKDASGSPVSSNFDSLVSRLKSALGYALALVIGPISAIVLGGWEGRSPLARRYRESFLSGGIFSKLYWGFAIILAVLVVHYLGLWIAVLLGSFFGVLAGAAYYFGIEKPLAAKRRETVEGSQGLLKQLRLRGMDEEHVQLAFARHSGKNWEELFENIFGYDCMRLMKTRLEQSQPTSRNNVRTYRDKLIDRWDARLTEARRASEEKLLAQTEKAELVAAGISAAEAQKRAEAVAASLVDAAAETQQAMKELAAGKLTDQAATEKRQRIKQMLAEARSGKVNNKVRSSRALDLLLGQLLGSKFRFTCAAMLLLATGMWVSANRRSLENYWQQAKSTVSNLSIEAGLEGAAETAKSTLANTAQQQWTPVLAGLVTQDNVVFVALAGLIMVWGTLSYGWKKSLFFVPLTLLTLAIPMFV